MFWKNWQTSSTAGKYCIIVYLKGASLSFEPYNTLLKGWLCGERLTTECHELKLCGFCNVCERGCIGLLLLFHSQK